MSRVWKKFFYKIGKAVTILVSITAIIVGSIAILTILGLSPEISVIIVFSLTIFIPMLLFILYQVYSDCKDEVNDENKKIMRDLKGF